MATPGAEFTTLRHKVPTSPSPLRPAEVELEATLQELEKKIVNHRDRPISALLMEVMERVNSLTGADGAAIAVCDPWGVICRASVGQAPEIGSRLHPDSALTRECFETGQIVICEDTETDYRVRRATARSLRLRSAVVVPLQARGSVLGVMEVLSSRPSAFSTTHIAGLQRIGERMTDILAAEPAPAEPSEPPPEGSLAVTLAQPEKFAETVPAQVATLPPPAKPKSRLSVFLLAAVLLLFLPLLYFAVRIRQAKAPSSPAVAPALSTETPAVPAAQPQSIPQPATGAPPLEPGVSPHPALPAATSAPLPGPAVQPGGERSAAAPEKPPAERQAAAVIRPAVPALVIQGVLPGTQIFVDGQLVASTDPSGHASISTLADGVHHLRLRFNGYRDYEQSFDVQPGKTSTVAAKLESLEPPAFSERPRAAILAVTPAVPEPVTSTRLSSPNFALDRTLKAHSGWVTGVAFSPDGQRLASGSWDRTVKFWEVTLGKQLSPVASKMKEIQSLAFSRDGHWLATENSSNTVALRDPVSGQEIRALASDKPLGALGSNWVYSIAFSPDGQLLASGLDDKTVRLWDVKTGGEGA